MSNGKYSETELEEALIGRQLAAQGWRGREAQQVEIRDGVLFDTALRQPLLTETVKWTRIPDGPVEVLLFVRSKP